MKTVQIYIGRTAIDLDCIIVNFVLDGVKHTFEVEKMEQQKVDQLTNIRMSIML